VEEELFQVRYAVGEADANPRSYGEKTQNIPLHYCSPSL